MINGEDDDVMLVPVLHSFSPSIVNCMRNITTELTLSSGTINLSEQAWNCLGCILSTNTSVTRLDISLCDLNVAWLFAGLQYNQNIKKFRFYGVDLSPTTKMNSLAPFLSNNPSLREITLSNCRIGQGGINTLASALMNRAADTLKYVDLDGNDLGDCNLDGLVTLLSTCKKLMFLYLSENSIGQRECTYLAQLLMSPESNLTHLYLCNNRIDDEALGILTGSLSNNTKLRTLALYGNSKITRSGWRSLLKLACDTSSMTAVKDSNHTLRCLGIYGDEMQAAVVSALGDDDAKLLFASLKLNWISPKSLITRQKMIWAHVWRLLK